MLRLRCATFHFDFILPPRPSLPAPLLDRGASGVDKLFVFVTESGDTQRNRTRQTKKEASEFQLAGEEEVRRNQSGTIAPTIMKADRRVGANALHHCLFCPARIADLT